MGDTLGDDSLADTSNGLGQSEAWEAPRAAPLVSSAGRWPRSEVAIETAANLLERARELSEVGNALAEAQDGRGQFVLVEAPAGLGKTSLLRAASEAAAGLSPPLSRDLEATKERR